MCRVIRLQNCIMLLVTGELVIRVTLPIKVAVKISADLCFRILLPIGTFAHLPIG